MALRQRAAAVARLGHAADLRRHDAVAAGRRLRATHKEFRGTRDDGKAYYALEPEAYAWVHATLHESYVAGHAQFGRPMTRGEAERFYDEYRGWDGSRAFAHRTYPPNWTRFASTSMR